MWLVCAVGTGVLRGGRGELWNFAAIYLQRCASIDVTRCTACGTRAILKPRGQRVVLDWVISDCFARRRAGLESCLERSQ